MERAEKVGLGAAVLGHGVLFGLLSVGFLATPNPDRLKSTPVEVSLVEEVAIESAAPEPAAEPAQSVAPEEGAPEDAAPPEPAPAPPEPAPPEPRPAPPPPAPAPAPRPRPAPPKPAPAPKPASVPKPRPPEPRPVAAAPKAALAKPAQPKVAAARPAQPKTAARPIASKQTAATVKKGTGSTQTASNTRPRGSRLGDDFLKGLSAERSRPTNPDPLAARIGEQAAANIGSAIQRQIQPCANRQVSPGPGANRIRVAINLRINRDGSLAGRPTVRGHTGVDDDNSRYVDRVDDLVIAAVVGCAPLRGLPPELYDVPGGWGNFTLRYKLPG